MLEDLKNKIITLRNKKNSLVEKNNENFLFFQKMKKEEDNLSVSLDICQKISQNVQQLLHSQISEVVSECLHDIFPENLYDFEIKFSRERNKTAAKLTFIKDGHELKNPLNEIGGGIIDVTSFVLRLIALVYQIRKSRNILIFDEPLKNISVEYRKKIRILLENLSKKFGVQIIMVTHIEELITGNIIKLTERKKTND